MTDSEYNTIKGTVDPLSIRTMGQDQYIHIPSHLLGGESPYPHPHIKAKKLYQGREIGGDYETL